MHSRADTGPSKCRCGWRRRGALWLGPTPRHTGATAEGAFRLACYPRTRDTGWQDEYRAVGCCVGTVWARCGLRKWRPRLDRRVFGSSFGVLPLNWFTPQTRRAPRPNGSRARTGQPLSLELNNRSPSSAFLSLLPFSTCSQNNNPHPAPLLT